MYGLIRFVFIIKIIKVLWLSVFNSKMSFCMHAVNGATSFVFTRIMHQLRVQTITNAERENKDCKRKSNERTFGHQDLVCVRIVHAFVV